MVAILSQSARVLVLWLLLWAAGCKTYSPVAHKEPIWSPDLARVTTGEIVGDMVTLHNVRHCDYRTSTDHDVTWYDKVIDLSKIRTVDFVMVPFGEIPGLAHTQLSYGFEGDDYLGVSVEIRRREGETYSTIKGMMNYFPLHYVFADERDLIGRRAIYDLNDVYVYRANATPEQARAMFVDMVERANKLAKKPEYYNTVLNNCTTNVVRHVNRVAKYEKVPFSTKILFPGYSDKLAYQLGLIATDKPFPAAKEAARVNEEAFTHRDDPNFSSLIRR